MIYDNITLVVADDELVGYSTPFSAGLFYAYLSVKEKMIDVFDSAEHGFVDLKRFVLLDVDSSSFKHSMDSDYNLECEGGMYCMATGRVSVERMCHSQCITDWSECPSACPEAAPLKCPDGSCTDDIKKCACPAQLPFNCTCSVIHGVSHSHPVVGYAAWGVNATFYQEPLCVQTESECSQFMRCSASAPYQCADFTCQSSLALCSSVIVCPPSSPSLSPLTP